MTRCISIPQLRIYVPSHDKQLCFATYPARRNSRCSSQMDGFACSIGRFASCLGVRQGIHSELELSEVRGQCVASNGCGEDRLTEAEMRAIHRHECANSKSPRPRMRSQSFDHPSDLLRSRPSRFHVCHIYSSPDLIPAESNIVPFIVSLARWVNQATHGSVT